MKRRHPLPLAAYAYTIQLIYPRHLCDRYHGQMLQTARDADRDRTYSALQFWAYLYAELFRSSLQEHTRMFRNQLLARPVFFYTLTLAVLFTVWGLFAAMSIQGALRRSADQPQLQMAQDYAAALAGGRTVDETLPPVHVDIAKSPEPFAIFYSSDGRPVGTTGQIDQNVPAPPAGVFDYLRTHPTDKFTWQPQSGLRIAAVALRVGGAHPGVILVGRSLQHTEESTLRRGTFLTWFLLMGILAAGAIFLDRAQHGGTRPAAA